MSVEKIQVVRYRCDCGRKYASKSAALRHDNFCVCWTNPKYRTCKTCKFGKQVLNSNGMENEPLHLHQWKEWQCSNPKFSDGYFTPAHKNAPDLNINCFIHELK